MEFPERIYTQEEVKRAKELIDKGYKHDLRISGTSAFKDKVNRALEFVRVAGYYDFLRACIRSITEIDGLTQLHVSDAVIWANKHAVENPVDAASLFIQKANSMMEYLEGRLYYGSAAEKRSVDKRIEFLESLKQKTEEKEVKEECERLLRLWSDSRLVY